MPQYDLERICRIIKDIEKFFNDLKEIKVISVDDLRDKQKFYAVSMIMFSILNRTIDLADEVVASLDVGMPATYRDIFHLLNRNGYISDSLSKELLDLVYYRNLLAHEYYDFNEQDIYNILQKINTANGFMEIITELVKKGK